MSVARRLRPSAGLHADPLSGRLLTAYLISVSLHGLLLVALTGGWLAAPQVDRPPVYMVDLVHKPVLNPQAGRPEPRRVAPPAPAPPPELPSAPAARVPAPVKAAVSPKVPAKTAPGHVQDALQKLREEQALQQRLAAMRQALVVPAETPVGMADAKGSEAGVDSMAYIQEFIRQNWMLSPYMLADKGKMARIEAWVFISYGKSGRMEGFRFERESGDPQFDESIKRALIKSQQLPNALPQKLEDVRVKFNLKELAEVPQ